MQKPKHFFRFCGIALLIILPILLSLEMRKQLGEDAYLRAEKEINNAFSNNGFWVKEYDFTFFFIIVGDVRSRFLAHSIICTWAGAILVSYGIEQKNPKIYPLVISYSILAMISLHGLFSEFLLMISPGLYNQLSRLAFHIYVFRGAGAYTIYIGIVLSYLFYIISELKQKKKYNELSESAN